MLAPFPAFRPVVFTALIAAGLAAATTLASGEVKRDVVYVPTPHEVVGRMMEMAEVKSGDYLIDFGCGDGRMVVAAAKIGATGYGVDIDPERIEEANANAQKAGVTDKVKFEVANLFEKELGDADVMAMYLLTEINLKLRPKILSDIVDGRRIYMWYVPAKVDGRWELKNGEQRLTLELKQDFQKVSGTVKAGNETGKIESGRLTGEKLELTVVMNGQKHRLQGRVTGDEMRGDDGKWTASAVRRS